MPRLLLIGPASYTTTASYMSAARLEHPPIGVSKAQLKPKFITMQCVCELNNLRLHLRSLSLVFSLRFRKVPISHFLFALGQRSSCSVGKLFSTTTVPTRCGHCSQDEKAHGSAYARRTICQIKKNIYHFKKNWISEQSKKWWHVTEVDKKEKKSAVELAAHR